MLQSRGCCPDVVLVRRKTKPCVQQMADPPDDRVTHGKPPFIDVGLDYFGTFTVKREHAHATKNGCIFTCLATRAVHTNNQNNVGGGKTLLICYYESVLLLDS